MFYFGEVGAMGGIIVVIGRTHWSCCYSHGGFVCCSGLITVVLVKVLWSMHNVLSKQMWNLFNDSSHNIHLFIIWMAMLTIHNFSFRLVLRFCVEVSYHVYRPDSCFTSKLMKHSCFLTIFIASHTSVQLYPTLLYIIWLLKSSLKWFVNIDWEWVMNLWLNCFISDYLLLYGCF